MTRAHLALVTATSALCSLAGGFLASLAFQPSTALAQTRGQVVQAKQFEVVDDAGKTRAFLGMLPDGAVSLTLFGPGGGPQLVLASKPDGSGKLAFLDASGKVRLAESVDGPSGVTISLHDSAGSARVSEAYREDGTSALLFAGPDGKQSVSVIAGPDKPSTLLLNGPGNGAGAMMSVLGDARAFFALMSEGKARLRGMLQQDGSPQIEIMNAKGEAVWSQAEKK